MYDTNSRLSRLLIKLTEGVQINYVYGLGLIGEETDGDFKTYHFDSRGSTIAITDEDGNITDTFAYDTYGKMTSRTGTTPVIFGYNGRYGVVTDANGLLYMRARYYSPVMRRFVNADIVAGDVSNSITLNRYAFADANPVLNVDPLGLMAGVGSNFSQVNNSFSFLGSLFDFLNPFTETPELLYKFNYNKIKSAQKPKRVPKGSWILKNRRSIPKLNETLGDSSKLAKSLKNVGKALDVAGKVADGAEIVLDTTSGIVDNINNGTRTQKIVSDAIVDAGVGIGITAGSTAFGAWVGSFIPIPVVGTLVGAGAGYLVGEGVDWLVNEDLEILDGKSVVDWAKDGAAAAADWIVEDLPDIADDAWEATTEFVEEAWDATTEFIENSGESIVDFFEDVGDAVGGFFEDTGKAIVGFFSGLFG